MIVSVGTSSLEQTAGFWPMAGLFRLCLRPSNLIRESIRRLPAERWFLLKNGQTLVSGENIKHAEAAWNEAANAGIERGTQSFFNFVMSKVAKAREVSEGADRLDQDVERVRLTSAAMGEPVIEATPASIPERSPPPIPPPTRSMPMAAPPTREARTMSGRTTSRSDDLKSLTPEERKIARDSIPDRPDAPHMTDAQKEYAYLMNKRKYAAMKANGTYDDQGRR